jgi:hypothetical protein
LAAARSSVRENLATTPPVATWSAICRMSEALDSSVRRAIRWPIWSM